MSEESTSQPTESPTTPTEIASERVARLTNELAEFESRQSDAKPAEKPTLFSHESDAKLTAELGAIFDKQEAKSGSRGCWLAKAGRLGRTSFESKRIRSEAS